MSIERVISDAVAKQAFGESTSQEELVLLFNLTDLPRTAESNGSKPLSCLDPLNDRILARLDRELNTHGKSAGDPYAKGRVGTPGRIS